MRNVRKKISNLAIGRDRKQSVDPVIGTQSRLLSSSSRIAPRENSVIMVINERTMSPRDLGVLGLVVCTGAARSETRSHVRDTYRDGQTMPRRIDTRGNSYFKYKQTRVTRSPPHTFAFFPTDNNLARVTHGFPLEDRSSSPSSRVKAIVSAHSSI